MSWREGCRLGAPFFLLYLSPSCCQSKLSASKSPFSEIKTNVPAIVTCSPLESLLCSFTLTNALGRTLKYIQKAALLPTRWLCLQAGSEMPPGAWSDGSAIEHVPLSLGPAASIGGTSAGRLDLVPTHAGSLAALVACQSCACSHSSCEVLATLSCLAN